MLAGLGIGVVLGAVNGAGITLGRLPPFIMTLGMMVMGRGLAMTISDGHPIHFKDASADFAWLGQGHLLGLPVPVWIFAVVAASAYIVLRYTPFGRNIYAVGSNPEAARLAGIDVGLVVFSVYVISGALSALTALIFVSRLTVGEPVAGVGLELEAIAVTVIGGTSLFGGEGGVVGTVMGAAIFAVLANILNLAGVSPFTQQIVKGAIIVFAVLFETQRRRRSNSA
jgi:ribose transport system permease protein